MLGYLPPAQRLHLLSDSYSSSSCSSSCRSWETTGRGLFQGNDWLLLQGHLTCGAKITNHICAYSTVCSLSGAVATGFYFLRYVPTLCALVDNEEGQRWSPLSPPWGDKPPDRSSITERVAGHNWGTDSEERGSETFLYSTSYFYDVKELNQLFEEKYTLCRIFTVVVTLLSQHYISIISALTCGTLGYWYWFHL